MNALEKLTVEQKEHIVNLYKSGKNPREIENEVGLYRKAVYDVLDEAGVDRPHRTVRKTKTETVCPKCRATGHLKGARFCFRCGQDIRSEEIILRERVQKILRDIQLMPESARNEASDTLQEIMRYLEKQGA